MKRALAATALAGLLGVGAWQAAEALQNETAAEAPATAPTPAEPEPAPEGDSDGDEERAPRATEPRQPPLVRSATPMAERVAVLGLLNKRNGIARDLRMRPGQALRVGEVIVRLRACETTAPWEPQKLTGAFVQTDVLGRDEKWRRVFSGWLYRESPSLNAVEHPIYDVWPKSCEMRHPEMGPDTVAGSAGRSGSDGPRRSNAKKSEEPAPEPPSPSAESSNDT